MSTCPEYIGRIYYDYPTCILVCRTTSNLLDVIRGTASRRPAQAINGHVFEGEARRFL